MNAVRLRGVAVERAGVRVVHDVDMIVPTGGWFGVIGANGSGKTTLLRALAGRLAFAGGRCDFAGEDLTADRLARAERVGFAPPADRLPEALRVGDLLALVGGDIATARARLGIVGDALGIDALSERWIGDCSAGMRQRAAVALAFAGGHAVVVLDEPFNWLDPVVAYDLRQALRRRVDEGVTLVTALHDLTTLATACDTGAMLTDGRVALPIDAAMLRAARAAPQDFEARTMDLLRAR